VSEPSGTTQHFFVPFSHTKYIEFLVPMVYTHITGDAQSLLDRGVSPSCHTFATREKAPTPIV
jgi:hypothetical protein